MPRDTGTAQRRSGYEWPLAIIFLYLWQIIVVVIAEYLLIGGLIFFGFKTCHQLQPEDIALILLQVANLAALVFTISKFLYIALYLLWAFGNYLRHASIAFNFVFWFAFAFGSVIFGMVYTVILKIRSRKAEIRDEERPLLDEDRPREPPAHPGIL